MIYLYDLPNSINYLMYIHFLCVGNFWRKYYFLPLYYTHSIDPKEDLERDERKRLKGQYIEVMDVNHFILILLLVYRINTNIFFIL